MLRLPNEILLLVVALLLERDLLSLALSCSRLHTLALLEYLARCNVHHDPESKSLTLFGSVDGIIALPALRMALFVTHIQTLQCSFQEVPELNKFLESVRELRRLVSKMSGLEQVTIDFSNVIFGEVLWMDTTVTHMQYSSDWYQAVGELLDAIADKCPCTSFTLQDHGQMNFVCQDLAAWIEARFYQETTTYFDSPAPDDVCPLVLRL
jgi:hypothetical protein